MGHKCAPVLLRHARALGHPTCDIAFSTHGQNICLEVCAPRLFTGCLTPSLSFLGDIEVKEFLGNRGIALLL